MNQTTSVTPITSENKSANFRTAVAPGVVSEKAASGEADYSRSIRSLVRALHSRQIPLIEFQGALRFAVERGLTRAWWEGAAEVGITQGEETDEENNQLYTMLFSETSQVSSFGSAILDAPQTRTGLNSLLKRAEMWTLRYVAFRSLAMSIFGRDKKLKWVMNPLKEHCTSCLALNGRIYRASTWRRYDIYPRKRTLECRGFRCGCHFETTRERATPGRPPAVA